jgi:hypothetical protein
VVDEAVKMGALVGNPVRAVKPLRATDSAGVALDRDETRALLVAVAGHRLGAAVALLFLQGWRVSEVLGLAWEDVEGIPRPWPSGQPPCSTPWPTPTTMQRPRGSNEASGFGSNAGSYRAGHR